MIALCETNFFKRVITSFGSLFTKRSGTKVKAMPITPKEQVDDARSSYHRLLPRFLTQKLGYPKRIV